MKPSLLVVDHPMHKTTRSSEFFLSELAHSFELTLRYTRLDGTIDPYVLSRLSDFDFVLLWQVDYLAPLFLAKGKKTIVVPMYDGSANMPALHWLFGHQAQYINFSLTLHSRVSQARGSSLLLKYFLPAVPTDRAADFSKGLRAFFWERTPATGFGVAGFLPLFGDQLSALHVHQVSDPGQAAGSIPRDLPVNMRLTTSHWFQDKAEYYNVLARCNVFVAPRMSEGIGMAMLEAMSRGMLVVAADDAVHNEYIANWVNGVLFNPGYGGIADFSNAAELGANARHTSRIGHNRWTEQKSSICPYILSSPEPKVRSSAALDRFCEGLCSAYTSGVSHYLDFLLNHSRLLRDFFPSLTHEELAGVVPSSKQRQRRQELSAPLLEHPLAINLSNLEDYAFCGDGWSTPEPGARWIDGLFAELHFTLTSELSTIDAISVHCRTLKEIPASNRVCVLINGRFVDSFQPTSSWKSYSLSIKPGTLSRVNTLSLHATYSAQPIGDSRTLSLCVQRVVLQAKPSHTPLRARLAIKGLMK